VSQTLYPSWAKAWASEWPMVPAPTMVILRISIMEIDQHPVPVNPSIALASAGVAGSRPDSRAIRVRRATN